MSTFSKQEKLASDLLQRKGIFIIHKVTRAGTSFTITKVALEKGLKVVVLTPTKRIIRNLQEKLPSLLGYSPRMITVGPNSELCQKLDKKLSRKLAFQFKEDCNKCELNGKPSQCSYQNLLMNEFDVYCLTYDKLRALMQYQSKDTTMIIDKLSAPNRPRVLILDEDTTAVHAEVQTIELIYDYNGLAKKLSDDIEALLPTKAIWADILRAFLKLFENVKENGILENNVWNAVLLPDKARQDFFVDGWLYITGRTKRGLDTKDLQRIFLSMFAKKVVITVDNGKISLTPMVEDALAYLKTFVSKFGKDKTVFVVDSYQPSVNFQSLFGTEVTPVNWGDPLNTNAKQLVIADTAHWGARDFAKDPKLRTRIQQTLEHVLTQFLPEQVIIVTTNKSMKQEISYWNLPKTVMITYFRSDWMRGVQAENRRVMVCVGGPYLPKKAYTDSSKSFKISDFVVEMDQLRTDAEKARLMPYLFRLDGTRGEFWNSVGRIKDPEGKERSVVFTLGMQIHEVKALLKDNSDFPIPKPHVTQTMFGGGMFNEGLTIATLWFDGVEVEQPKHLAVIARIICHTLQKESVSASQVIIGQTELVKGIALKYQSVLEKYGVKVTFKQGGISFEKA